ncbi:hypothetical protein RND71_011756 [Anisodus tanguticus]|uniref:non-specific serine/threonine protein kinase n=1 Tax=Anisodus tanguticus TaxID=243964 RepID=A0AAE1SBX6_9SOLA|nr:hypothetical protein RND71_011756 [Anisodus tanguticus]
MKGLLSFQFLAYTVLLFILIHLSYSLESQWFASCSKSFNCGNITRITYPFWGNDRPKECGYPGFELQCNDHGNTIIQISNIKYLVLNINLDAQIITVTRNKDLAADWICQFNTTIDNSNIFEYASTLVNFTFNYACPRWAGVGGGNPPLARSFNCPINGMSYKNGFAIGSNEGDGTCHASIVVPGRKDQFSSGGIIGDLGALKELLEQGFDVRWKVDSSHCKDCEKIGGRCGFDVDAKVFSCLCPDDQYSSSSKNVCTKGYPGTEIVNRFHPWLHRLHKKEWHQMNAQGNMGAPGDVGMTMQQISTHGQPIKAFNQIEARVDTIGKVVMQNPGNPIDHTIPFGTGNLSDVFNPLSQQRVTAVGDGGGADKGQSSRPVDAGGTIPNIVK